MYKNRDRLALFFFSLLDGYGGRERELGSWLEWLASVRSTRSTPSDHKERGGYGDQDLVVHSR